MNLFSLYATLTLDDNGYKKSVKNSISYGKTLKEELQKVDKQVSILTEQYKKSVSETGRFSDETKKLADELEEAKKKQSDLRSEIEKTSSSLKDFSTPLKDIGSKLKTGFSVAAGAVTAVGGALTAASVLTEDYRIAQGKLNSAFEAAGYSSETAKNTYNEFYKILGDTDTATEASQLLANLAENEREMEKWTKISAGVWGTFGDALPIEGLIESANETAKVGQVTGSLADALNWAGISEEDFNKQLERSGSESNRNKLIISTLSSTYNKASDAFYKNNEQIVKNREQQALLTDAMANVGGAVDKVKSAFLEQFAPAIAEASLKLSEWISNLDVEEIINNVIEKVVYIKDTFLNWLPAIVAITSAILTFKATMAISAVIDAVTKAIQNFKKAQDAATLAQAAWNAVSNANPYVLIATLIAGVVAALIVLWNTNEDFRNAVKNIWEYIKNIFASAWNFIQNIWDEVKPYFSAIWESIKSIFSPVAKILGEYFKLAWSQITFVWDVATDYFQTLWDTIKGIFSAVESVLKGDFEGAWNAIKDVFKSWGEFFKGLFDKVKEPFENIGDTFKNIGKKIIEALKKGISDAWKGLKKWFNNLWDGLFGNRTANVTVNTRENRTVNTVNGSHAKGLSYVPFDGYIAELHKGETVLTAEEAEDYRSMRGGITVVQNIYSQAKTAADLMREARQAQERAVLLGV